jgi:hypothetical protein
MHLHQYLTRTGVQYVGSKGPSYPLMPHTRDRSTFKRRSRNLQTRLVGCYSRLGLLLSLAKNLSLGFVDSRSERTIVFLGYQNDENCPPLPSWAAGEISRQASPPYKAPCPRTNGVALNRLLPAYIVLVTSVFQYQHILIAADPPSFVLDSPTQILASDQSLKYYKHLFLPSV